jgi:hypothetical protein
MRKLMISTVFTALAAFSLPAAAQSIVLGPSSGFQSQNCDVVSTVGGDIDVDCFRPGTGTASFGSASGPWFSLLSAHKERAAEVAGALGVCLIDAGPIAGGSSSFFPGHRTFFKVDSRGFHHSTVPPSDRFPPSRGGFSKENPPRWKETSRQGCGMVENGGMAENKAVE